MSTSSKVKSPFSNSYFLLGVLLTLCFNLYSIQQINKNIHLQILYISLIFLLNLLCVISIFKDFYEDTIENIIKGISFASFYSASIQIIIWIFGSWELINSVFSIILSLYLASLFNFYDMIYKIYKSKM